METADSRLWHHLSAEDVLAQLETDPEGGLTAAEIERRRSTYGSNVLTAKRRQSLAVRFLFQFRPPPIYATYSK
ncbi:MAG: hypothetical protein JSU70_12660 [Phycisphaerales bacterium]|nr:MAG: hypothetical protein JSU70_12660 [Phycisphaerales bacterium]